MKGKRLTNKEFDRMISYEMDRALTLPDNFDEVITSFMKNEPVTTISNESTASIGTELEKDILVFVTSKK